MQKTLEVLKNEDGLTICKLSDRKWLFKYKIPLETECGQVVRYINGKMRYLTDEEKSVYLPINNMLKLERILSVSTGVAMKNMNTFSEQETHLGKNFSLIKKIIIRDKNWIRDFKIKKLTNELNND